MKFKLVVLTLMAALMIVGTAFAEERELDVKITLAQPFSVDSVAEANFGTLYTTGGAETITMDVTGVAPVVGDDAAAAAPTHTDGKISRGGAPIAMAAGQTVGVVYIAAIEAGVDLNVALVGAPTLEIPYSSAPTPINVVGITSNVAAFNALDAAGFAATKVGSLSIGPVLEVPINAELGAYSGKMTVDVTAI